MNVLIVDDEPFQRKSLCNLAVWHEEKCEIVGSAVNGEDALRILDDCGADLVVTDIRMPSMDGVELAKQVRLRFPTTRVVVLSAFSDFHLVKDSFQTGVYDYLLKAEVNEGQIREIIHRIRSDILTTSSMELRNRGYLTYETCLRELKEDRAKLLLSMGTEISHHRFVCFGYKLTTSNDAVMTEISRRLRSFHRSLPIRLEPFKMMAVMAVPEELNYARIEAHVEHLLIDTEFRESLMTSFDWSAGIDSFFSDLDRLPQQLSTVNAKLEKTFFWGWNRLYRHSCDETDTHQVLDELKMKRALFLSVLYHKSFAKQDLERLQVTIDPEFATATTVDQVRNYFRWVGSQIQNFGLENNLTFDEDLPLLLRDFNATIGRGDTLAGLNGQQSRIMMHLGKLSGDRHSLVSKAKEYIRAEIPRECLVSEIAATLGISTEHLSRTFKAREDMSLKTYITGERIRFANKLMVNGEMKIYEIAEASGFASVEHFSRTFKKIMGIGPKQHMTR